MRILKGILVLTIIISLIGCSDGKGNNIEILLDIFKMNVFNGDYKIAKNVYEKAKNHEEFITGINEILISKSEELEGKSLDESRKYIEEYIRFLEEIGQASFGDSLRNKLGERANKGISILIFDSKLEV